MTTATYVNRDPFARETLTKHREHGKHTCDWCGQVKHTPSGRPYVFRYEVETDGGRTFEDQYVFCSIGCRRSYYS